MTALTALLLAGCKTPSPTSPARSVTEDTGGPLMKEQAAYDVQHYDLSLRVDPAKKYISGTGTIEVNVLEPMSWLVLDLDPRLKVKRVRLANAAGAGSGNETSFEHRGSKLWVFLDQLRPAGSRVVAAVDYEGHPREAVKAPWDGGPGQRPRTGSRGSRPACRGKARIFGGRARIILPTNPSRSPCAFACRSRWSWPPMAG